ncbi:response regulator [Porticoccaceae bacterium]|nr:response regulator [Porticoccaceae bacterium]
MNYLVVDDDQAFCQVLSRVLMRQGYSVCIANNGQQAAEYCDNDSAIERVILDLKLEQESGLSILVDIKQRLPSAEVLILSGYSSISTAVQAIKLGAVNYLCKPASAEDIVQAFSASNKPIESISATPTSVNRLEWEHIQRVLNDNDGNISATARSLGMHRRTLQRKLQKKPSKT